MTCEYNNCKRPAKDFSSTCEIHGQSVTVMYHEWDKELWYERRELLAEMWKTEEHIDRQKKVISDLLIHSNDIYE